MSVAIFTDLTNFTKTPARAAPSKYRVPQTQERIYGVSPQASEKGFGLKNSGVKCINRFHREGFLVGVHSV